MCVFSEAFCKKQTKKHYLLLRSLSQRCQIEAWLEGRLKETPTGEGKNQNQTYPSSLFWCFLIKFFGDCLIGKKSSHLGVGRESESRPSWPLCKRILPAESGLESLLWSAGEKVKVKIKLATKLCYWQIQTQPLWSGRKPTIPGYYFGRWIDTFQISGWESESELNTKVQVWDQKW